MAKKIISVIIILLIISVPFFFRYAEVTKTKEQAFKPFHAIEPLGVSTLCLLLVTFSIGLVRRKLKADFLGIHTMFAVATIAVALTHGIMVMVLF